jgi:hypothetical protein
MSLFWASLVDARKAYPRKIGVQERGGKRPRHVTERGDSCLYLRFRRNGEQLPLSPIKKRLNDERPRNLPNRARFIGSFLAHR